VAKVEGSFIESLSCCRGIEVELFSLRAAARDKTAIDVLF
jgi:hypothetical protein